MNLLTDQIFKTITPSGPTRFNLPDLLTALGDNRVETLTSLQRHQADIFHIFICYLAAAVLSHSARDHPRQSSDFWRDGLRGLAGRNDDLAWTLVVDDPTQPAFMQPPASSRAVFAKDYKPKALTPDALDVLQNAKNHDVKAHRAVTAGTDDWAMALISLQTAEGFLGVGNYGIARMNGGFGSRVCVGWQTDRSPGSRFQRDVSVLLRQRTTLLDTPFVYRPNGKTLLWLEPWDGRDSLALSELDPFFTEVARRVRLVARDGSILALGATSECARLATKSLNGNVGDPWTPIHEAKLSALTPSKAGLTPKLLRDILFRKGYQPAPMQLPPTDGKSGWFCVSVLIRGQGTTDGFHESAIRVPGRALPVLLGKSAAYDRFAGLSQKGLDLAGDIQKKVLKPALFSLMEGGATRINWDKREVKAWVDTVGTTYTQQWPGIYFKWLWTTLDESDDLLAIKPWFNALRNLAQHSLELAISRAPFRKGRGYRSIVGATGMFHGCIHKHFADLLEG